ncbi:MAG TPA: hypothetical protein DCS91_14515 [Microcoleaceae bacterium UBA11344]|nr:hypothetical protein [Microcoleaceae cyanobacterium UBA11344]
MLSIVIQSIITYLNEPRRREERAGRKERFFSYCLWLFRNVLTAEAAEDTELEKREMNDSDTNGFDLIPK